MNCEEYKKIFEQNKKNGEINEDFKQKTISHIKNCPICSEEYKEYIIKEENGNLQFKLLFDDISDSYDKKESNKFLFYLGLIFLLGGFILLACSFILPIISKAEIIIKSITAIFIISSIGIGIGFIILLIYVIKERVFLSKYDKYSKEVKR